MSKYRSKSKSLETAAKPLQLIPTANFLSNSIDSIPANKSGVNQSTINLESGGSLNLSIDVNLFDLSETDRKFVLSVIDLVKNYNL
jgi:hypothetical protein